jgi:hypothetical protein
MKVRERKIQIEKDEGLQTTKFGIDQKNAGHIFEIMRSKIYSDKVLAIVREYTTNAVDEHIKTGQADRPIRVHVPTKFDPTLKIRDFGEGLTDQEIREVYCQFAASTKRQSNDFTGQMGIGSKSGFAYTDSFSIISFQGGKKRIYSAYLDSGGTGEITLQADVETDEEDGIEIQISIKHADIHYCQQTCEKLFRFFDVYPEVIGMGNKTIKDTSFTFEGKNWKIAGLHNPSYAIMGNIGYPISFHILDNLDNEERNVLNLGAWIKFPIGSLDIAASREELQYTKITKTNIKKALKSVHEQLQKKISNSVKDAKNIIEAKQLWHKVTQSLGIKTSVVWTNPDTGKDVNILNSAIDAAGSRKKSDGSTETYTAVVFKNIDGYSRKTRETYNFNVMSDYDLYVDDVKGFKWRVRYQALEEDGKKPLIIKEIEDGYLEAWIKKNDLQGVKIHKLSDVEPPKAKKSQKTYGANILNVYYGRFNYNDEVELDPQSKHYYMIGWKTDSVVDSDNKEHSIEHKNFVDHRMRQSVSDLGISDKCYLLRKRDIKKLGKNWERLEPTLIRKLQSEILKAIRQNKTNNKQYIYKRIPEMPLSSKCRYLKESINDLPDDHLIHQYLDFCIDYTDKVNKYSIANTMSNVANEIEIKMGIIDQLMELIGKQAKTNKLLSKLKSKSILPQDKTEEFAKEFQLLKEKIDKRYEMLEMTDFWSVSYSFTHNKVGDEKTGKKLVKYVKMVDKMDKIQTETPSIGPISRGFLPIRNGMSHKLPINVPQTQGVV